MTKKFNTLYEHFANHRITTQTKGTRKSSSVLTTPLATVPKSSKEIPQQPADVSKMQLTTSRAQAKKEKAIDYLNQLSTYGKILSKSNSEAGRNNGQLAISLAKELEQQINLSDKSNSKVQKQLLQILHQHDDAFDDRRFYGLKSIINNLSMAIREGITNNTVAKPVNYAKTESCFFYSKANRTEETKKSITEKTHPEVETEASHIGPQ
ncbi:hypothetical protein [Legionella cardiaca]|uniref:Substrate of the Dot/Icm secretion system n=1 Tax=Legionella cardiaca TaxID=1071983 RepID=A0ABY8ANH6_9GAMM|nr:hypothetical protein [Legionella cardiaca]WED42113.1 hypothetical protein PXX05_09240 [Legionella cardiaca]